ncbi:Leucine-rich repeat containing protein [Entamoeba marina]
MTDNKQSPQFTISELSVIVSFVHHLNTLTSFVFINHKCYSTYNNLNTTLLPRFTTVTLTPIELTVIRTLSILKVLKYFPNATTLVCDTDTIRILPESVFSKYQLIRVVPTEDSLCVVEHGELIKSLANKFDELYIKIDETSLDFPKDICFNQMTSLVHLSITFAQSESFQYVPKQKSTVSRFSKLRELKSLHSLQLLSISCEQTTAISLAPLFREFSFNVIVTLLYSEDNVDLVKEVMPLNVVVCCEYDSVMCESNRRETIILQKEGLSIKANTIGEMHLFEEMMNETLAPALVVYETPSLWMKILELTPFNHINSLQIEGAVYDIEVNIPTTVSYLKMCSTGYSLSNIDVIPLKILKLDDTDLSPNMFSKHSLVDIELKSCKSHESFIAPITLTRLSIADSDMNLQLNVGLKTLELSSYNRSVSLTLPSSLESLSTDANVPILSLPNLQHLDVAKLTINLELYPTTLTSLRVLMGSSQKQLDLTKFKKLERLSVIVCDRVRRIVLPHQIKFLMVYGCKDLIAVDNLKTNSLEELCITECNNLVIRIPTTIKRCFVDIPSVTNVRY